MSRILACIAVAISTALAALPTLGCASFAGRELPERNIAGLTKHGLDIDYETEWLTFGRPNPNARDLLSRSVRSVLEESGIFSGVTQGKGDAPHHFHFTIKNEGNLGLATFLGFISGLSLTIIPAYARDDYILTVDISSAGQPVKRYEYKDHLSTWIQLFLVVAMAGHDAAAVGDDVRSNMLRNFLHDLDRDLSSGELPIAPPPQ